MHKFKFAALRRCNSNHTIQHLECNANSEREARKQYARDYVLFFTAVIRNGGAA